jgi:hypothetical protein
MTYGAQPLFLALHKPIWSIVGCLTSAANQPLRRKARGTFDIKVKRLTVVAMFTDTERLDLVELKRENALDFVFKVSSRASIDLDFSVPAALERDVLDGIKQRPKAAFNETFRPAEFQPFGFTVAEKPLKVSSKFTASRDG